MVPSIRNQKDKFCMKVGDLVQLKEGTSISQLGPQTPGIIIDYVEMDDGFVEYEVMFESWGIGWFSDLVLRDLNKESN